jgi:uncharacterized protein YjlB
VFEQLFDSYGWRSSWRSGIYDYAHYHSSVRKVLGIARGSARVRFGGTPGRILNLKAGDVAILSAGTGHQCLKASADLLVVGAYPASGSYDECKSEGEREKAIAAIKVSASVGVSGRSGRFQRRRNSELVDDCRRRAETGERRHQFQEL